MYCFSCLRPLDSSMHGKCRRCGLAFRDEDPESYKHTYSALDHLRSWPAGIALSAVIGLVGLSVLIFMLRVQFGTKESALFWHIGVGLAIGGSGGLYAGWTRSWIARGLLLTECVIFFWAAFVGGVGAWFTTWQSMPNAPDDAYDDTGILGAVLVGWVPAALFVGGVFATTLWMRKHFASSIQQMSEPSIDSGAY
ncbi:MAG: hypothetical protein AAFR76_14850 [Planctomycetota bacterium]